ncbi:MAG: hypothetical protein JWP74_2688 [Marmoricola sp.]|nr:hypothetical protein [Marmoricola sp.]
MSTQTSVRYTTRDSSAGDANQRLIDAVFAELDDVRPEGFSYRVARSEDGLSFEHVAVVDGGTNPLPALATFETFSGTLRDRVVALPAVQTWDVVARYR